VKQISLAILAAAVLGACGAKQPSRGASRDDAIFYVKSNVADANLFVDGRYVGPVAILRGGIAVVPGKHRIELRHEDYYSRYVEMNLERAEKRKLQVDLAPVLP
jgi:hypothetical protein